MTEIEANVTLEVFFQENYQEISILGRFKVTEPARCGYFNHSTGDAEPPSGPEIELLIYEISRVEPKQISSNHVTAEQLRLVFGLDWARKILAEIEDRAIEKLMGA